MATLLLHGVHLEEIPDHVGRVELVARLADQPLGQSIDAARPYVPHVVDEILHDLDTLTAVAECHSLDAIGARVAARVERTSIEVAPLPEVFLNGWLLKTFAENFHHAAGGDFQRIVAPDDV